MSLHLLGVSRRADICAESPCEPHWIAAGDLAAAVVAPLPPATGPLRHAALLTAIHQHSDVLPMRFGVVLPDEQAVRDLLSRRRDGLLDELERLSGTVEFGLRIQFSLSRDHASHGARRGAGGEGTLRATTALNNLPSPVSGEGPRVRGCCAETRGRPCPQPRPRNTWPRGGRATSCRINWRTTRSLPPRATSAQWTVFCEAGEGCRRSRRARCAALLVERKLAAAVPGRLAALAGADRPVSNARCLVPGRPTASWEAASNPPLPFRSMAPA